MESLLALWQRALDPVRGFRDRAREDPPWLEAVKETLAWRTPVVLLQLVLGWWSFAKLFAALQDLEGPLWTEILRRVPDPVMAAQVRQGALEALRTLPVLPGFSRVLPWLLLLAPLQVLSVLLHDAAWDHGCLWILRGARKGWRATVAAESEALKVGTLGALAGLATFIPGTGCLLLPILLAVHAYFWVLRGIALAAWHDCPLWKGVTATLLHIVLLVLGALLFLGALFLIVSLAVS